MGLLNQDYESVSSSKPKRSDKISPMQELNARGLLDAATLIPVAGDAISGGIAAYDALKGDYGSAAMNALGILPFIGGAGMVKLNKTPHGTYIYKEPELFKDGSPGGSSWEFVKTSKRPAAYEATITSKDGSSSKFGDGFEGISGVLEYLRGREKGWW